MLITESLKSSNLPQMQTNENSSIGGGTPNIFSTATTVLTTNTGTPSFRSRNRPAADDKWEKADNASSAASSTKGKNPPKPPEEFYRDLQQYHEKRGTTIRNIPRITGREVDLHRLYCEVTDRGGFLKVNSRDEWDEVLTELGWKEKIVNGSAGLKFIYRRFLEKYERVNYFGEDPDKIDAMESAEMAELMGTPMGGRGGRGSSRYPTTLFGGSASTANNVAMTYNYKQHHVNMDRRRQFKLSTDLHKSSPYEKLMLSLLSPLPNEQDFAINACTLMANESKHTLKVNEYPKILDALLGHTGVFSDYTMRKLFQHVYNGVRHHSLHGFWHDLLHDQPQILDLYTDEQNIRDAGIIDDWDDGKLGIEEGIWCDSNEYDFLNLGRGLGIHDYVGQRVLQVVAILRNLSFFAENLPVLVKNRTLLRFLVMSSNIRWSNVHIQALEITGNIASDLELSDPTIDDLSRCLMSTICEAIDGPDRGVIINCLEILYKLCQRESNEDYVLKCLDSKFYNTIALFLSLNDIMLLLFTLEAIYALTCLGSKSCHSMMQVKGIVDQLVSLISVEAQSYGPDGCILMRVVETVPGNMLPMVAQNIANLQNAAVLQKSQPPQHLTMQQQQHKTQMIVPNPNIMSDVVDSIPSFQAPVVVAAATAPSIEHQQPQPQHTAPQIQMPQNFSHDDEQYALAWLGATFERTTNNECHVEQQELYRMYLSHCQKSGKHSVVNHMHFPRLVRLIFTSAVGPAIVRRVDGTDLPGLHYVSIRLRAQPLPLQQKPSIVAAGPNSPAGKPSDNTSPMRKIKKKLKVEPNTTVTSTPVDSATTAVVENIKPPTDAISPKPSMTGNEVINAVETAKTPQPVEIKCEEKMDIEEPEEAIKVEEPKAPKTPPAVEPSSSSAFEAQQSPQFTNPPQNQAQSSQTSLIKSLLANKVNQRQQKQKDLINTNVNAQTAPVSVSQPIKVPSTAITSLVNNPLMQNTPVKVGQTTIKPLNPQMSLEKKQHTISESTPPPLAPLSGANVAKDASGRPILLANQMLVDILDKKIIEPPLPASSSIMQKRKIDDQTMQNKRVAMEATSKDETPVTPSKNAANLYAEMAASILEDEDLEELSATQSTNSSTATEQPSLIMSTKVQQQSTNNTAIPRQLVFQTSNQSPQLKINQTSSVGQTTSHQMPNAVATIKTEQGLQTVPVILHQKPLDQTQHQQPQIIQQVMQPQQSTQTQTQYVLATNQQGQTYLVAQQSQPQSTAVIQQPQPTQTVLVTQTPQQQSTGAKTIIILQQNTLGGPGTQQQIITTNQNQQQKMIMTTPQGQQVLVTQRPQTPQQIFINPQTGTATHIQHVPVNPQNRQIIQTTTAQTPLPNSQQQQSSQLQAGQMSPSLLNQLNQIPATIKLHQPVAQTASNISSQPGTVTRMTPVAKGGMSIVQGHGVNTSTPTAPVAIPQLQQHQSIIQQHIISGPAEKRHVILGGGRAIEIKETVITQAQPPPQQCQLNSQTIITTQQPTPGTVLQHQHQQTQQSSESTASLAVTGATLNQNTIKKSLITGPPPTLIKPSLPTVKLPPGISSGPPPLAAVTGSNVIAMTANVNQPTINHPHMPPATAATAEKDNKRDDITRITPAAPQISTTSNSLSSTTNSATPTVQTSNTSCSSVPAIPSTAATATAQQPQPQVPPQPLIPQITAADAQWLFICDWRNCPRKKFKSLSDLQHHVCTSHAPDHLDSSAEIFCQWGVGPGLCDGIPRKRFSLMTHLIDRHLTVESLRIAVQRRIATGAHNIAPSKPPVTIVRNIELSQRTNTASPSLSTSSTSSSQTAATGSSALQAIKRHTADFMNSKELMDENEGPVTKSIRLTAALILRNLVIYTATAKRSIRRFEPHLATIALSNVESSGTISHILYELNN